MRIAAGTALLLALVALAASSVLGVASAEAPVGAASTATISVQGVGTAPIGDYDNATAATAVYREAAARALADAQTKGVFLASNAGATLGAADSVVEDGGYIECASPESQYASYEGEQPDFGYGQRTSFGVATVAPAAAPVAGGSAEGHVSHRPKVKRKKKRPVAKKATAVICTLTANVSVLYGVR